MTKVVITSLPTQGHFAPLSAIADDLVKRGHEVLFYTGRLFEERAKATGARFEPFPSEIDYTERAPGSPPPEHEQLPPAEQISYVLKHFFLNSAPYHDTRLSELLAEFPATTVIGELSIVGTLPMALRAPRGRRPTLVQIGIAPPTFESVDTAPFGPGLRPARRRNATTTRRCAPTPGRRWPTCSSTPKPCSRPWASHCRTSCSTPGARSRTTCCS
ncbi:glycosyltransferase [Actinacidiphila rubida]|uniref:glycosyltransferase n=1 Tax=Actinacidiphila rubida TaxID=310780 RepID=UPI001FE5770D|nr:hypothetical protein [Actinacidiphila rubida]